MRASPKYWIRLSQGWAGRQTYWYYTHREWDRVRQQARRAEVWYAAGRVRR